MTEKYPFYYEATYCDDAEIIHEGGFIIAVDYADAMQQIVGIYEPGLVDIKLECLDSCALFFPVKKAREIKKIIEEEDVWEIELAATAP